MKRIVFILVLFFCVSNIKCKAQFQKNHTEQKLEIGQEMEKFYGLMRKIDLAWMDYLTDNSTAVHNGEFLTHDEFIKAEKDFFNSLSMLKIEVITEPVIYILGKDGASVTQEHVVNLQTKAGQKSENIHQMMTFIWKRVNGKWKIAHAVFTTKS